MDGLTTTEGIAALAAGGLALVAVAIAVILAVKLRRLRSAQMAVLGEHGHRDLVAHAERLEGGFAELREWVEESLTRLEERLEAGERTTDGCIAYRALVRYDAWGEMSGRQSSSLALLDARRSGVVVSSILHRDQARVYVKQIHAGESDLELSPEEIEAIEVALEPAARTRA
jgi:hypothetical protein